MKKLPAKKGFVYIVQVINLLLLQAPLQAVPDDPRKGGTPGHLAITPLDPAGAVDQQLLEEWAASRGQDPPHPLTQMLLAAVSQPNLRGSP